MSLGEGDEVGVSEEALLAAAEQAADQAFDKWGYEDGFATDADAIWTDDAAAEAGASSAAWDSDGSGSFTDDPGEIDWLLAAEPPPPRPRKEIETTDVGLVSGPFRRRNGWHLEVRMQHDGERGESVHRLWASHEMVLEIGKLRSDPDEPFPNEAVRIEALGEEVLRYLVSKGVDLADPEWAMDDESVPFSTEYAAVRTLTNYYPDLKQHLAEVLSAPPAADADVDALADDVHVRQEM